MVVTAYAHTGRSSVNENLSLDPVSSGLSMDFAAFSWDDGIGVRCISHNAGAVTRIISGLPASRDGIDSIPALHAKSE